VYDQRGYYRSINNATRIFKQFKDPSFNKELQPQLIQGDCLENLKKIPSNSIDFCFADPPYNVKKKYNNWDDGIDIKEYFEWCDKWLSELARVLKPGCTLAVLNIPKWCIRHFKYLNTILDYQDWIVWEGRSLPSKNIVPIHYSILCFSKGQPRALPAMVRTSPSEKEMGAILSLKEGYCIREGCIKTRKKLGINDREHTTNIWWDIHRLMHNSRRVDHPCQLPPNFMYRLISLFTNKNEIILDPFNGAGTTTLCAEIMDRKYIGIELSKYYNEIALLRHTELRAGSDPFRKNNTSSPKVKNSRYERVNRANYKVSKKVLQLEIKDIANKLGRNPTKEEVFKMSQYPAEYFETHFLNWGEAFAAVRTTGMSEDRKTNFGAVNSQLKLL
ncbi:MAG: site-specific DNA-methyltransferase, partial [Sphingobacteriales bacterium]